MLRFLTEYTAADGARYAGALILADSVEMAEAILLCLQGPNGQPIRLLGEVVMQIPEGVDTVSVVRRPH